jgi:hypothetical protein
MITEYGMYGNRQDDFGYLAEVNQREIVEYCHAIGNLMNYAKDQVREIERAKVVTVCADGFQITQGMIDDEIARTYAPRPASVYTGPLPQIIGVNASSNQFA